GQGILGTDRELGVGQVGVRRGGAGLRTGGLLAPGAVAAGGAALAVLARSGRRRLRLITSAAARQSEQESPCRCGQHPRTHRSAFSRRRSLQRRSVRRARNFARARAAGAGGRQSSTRTEPLAVSTITSTSSPSRSTST